MSGLFFDELHIPKPQYNLGVGSGSHGAQTGLMMTKLEPILLKEHPDLVLVYGDTNSTIAGALVAAKLHIPVAHVEAGMRSFDRAMPEEVNRVLTDHVSDLLFCPSRTAVANLKAEGIRSNVFFAGDNMLDTLRAQRSRARSSAILKKIGVRKRAYVLFTLHRAGNTDSPKQLRSIIEALGAFREPVAFPAHPRTLHALERFGLLKRVQRMHHVHLVKPVGYIDMLQLMQSAKVILTDSGGIQKEAFALRVPCVTLRDTTEWVETVALRWNTLVGANPRRILQAVRHPRKPLTPRPVYGSGNVSKRIVRQILTFLRTRS